MTPSVTFSSPASMRNAVDLPEPEGPTRITNLCAVGVALGHMFENHAGHPARFSAQCVARVGCAGPPRDAACGGSDFSCVCGSGAASRLQCAAVGFRFN